MLSNVNFSPGIYVLFTVILIIVTVALTMYLGYRVIKERRHYREEAFTLIDGLLTKSEIYTSITSYLSKATKDTIFALYLIDLDKFSDVVNAFGQKQSEKILEKITQRIIPLIPKRTQIARVDKDQFLIFFRGEHNRSEYLNMAKDIQKAINTPLPIFHNTTIQVSSSIGISFYPAHGETWKQLQKSLDIALYIAKREGGNRIILYSDEMSATEGENLQYYHQIKEAIENKEFVLYYQPIINVKDQTIFGGEALLRWNHPEHGTLTPQHFINILEQSGDINWVGIWGLEELIKTHNILTKRFPDYDIKLSFNLSPKQLTNERLAVDFEKVLKRYKMHAKNIVLEIIEFAVFERYSVIHNNIKQLKELGFQIAIDGLGLDYNTLTKLEYLPIDIIKLDRSFLQTDSESMMRDKFAQMLVDFANTTDKHVVAEGVENKELLDLVSKHNINIIQGYYFCKPIPEADFLSYISNEEWKSKLIVETEPTQEEENLDNQPAEEEQTSEPE